MVYKFKNLSLLFASSLLICSCASVKKLSKELDAEGKTFATKPDKANVYVIRNEVIGAEIGMLVEVNGKLIGKTGAATYILESFEPGTLNIVSKAENDVQMSLDVRAGTNYYIWQEVKMGIMLPRNKLHIISEEDARKRIEKCDRVGIPDPSQSLTPQKVTTL